MSKKMNELLEKASKLYQDYQYDNALEIVNSLSQKEKNSISARSLKASILIQRWDGDLYSKNEIFEAIGHLKIVISRNPVNRNRYLYNLGNAYQKLAVFDLVKNGNKLNPEIIKNLELAKDHFEESLSIEDNRPDVWINLGNTLDYLGRYLEGIECYDNAIVRDPTHYNAWAARGTCCWHLSKFVSNEQDKKILMHHAMVFLKMDFTFNPSIPRDPAIKRTVDDYFKRNKSELNPDKILKKIMPRKRIVLDNEFNLYREHSQKFQEFYQNFCEEQGLFLNVHFDCSDCSCKSQDLIDFRFVTSIKDHQKPYELMKKWLALRDEYKTARAILAYAQYRPSEMIFLDKQRYEPDYSLNYLFNVELLKNSFVSIMDIYDKIALLLNYYEELGLPESSINFWGDTIFTQTNLLEKNCWNRHLVAMDSIRRDLEGRSSKDNKYKKMADVRNYLVHRYFNLHDIIDSKNLTYPYDPKNTPIRNPEYHMDIHEFFNLTLKAMRSARNLLFSLSFFVFEKETEKVKDSDKIIPTIEWTIDWEKNPELKKIADDAAEQINEVYQKYLEEILGVLKNNYNEMDKS
jgi:tetratricopeptide (TPR) repeat protein